ncbi:putative thymidine kinase [Aeromonas phage D6]|uniref:Thymidine kinase n=1 Tax=Aeromonas phage D6 TaxID=2593322 RepID=A0A514TWG4_9CAUD|nr:thymidine kinase [Aeromonas phage D6]QDJ97368.1 putative thymidine kinase [Aeromonas phage D6]
MSKVHFIYGPMNSSKTTTLITTAYNYREEAQNPVIMKPSLDTRDGVEPMIKSRPGLTAACQLFDKSENLFVKVAGLSGATQEELNWLEENLPPRPAPDVAEMVSGIRTAWINKGVMLKDILPGYDQSRLDELSEMLKTQKVRVKEYQYTRHQTLELFGTRINKTIDCVLVDEVQFLTEEQALDLLDIADYLRIPVMAFGLRNDFKGEIFPASKILMAQAEVCKENKGVCWCGRKATHVLRIAEDGTVDSDGPQVKVGGNDTYKSVCRYHHRAGMYRKPGI